MEQLRRLPWLLSTVCFASGTWAQVPAGAVEKVVRTFEVASIKPSPQAKPNPFGFPTRSSIVFGPEGTVDASQATLLNLILRAYGLTDLQVIGGPKWITMDRFDVAGRTESGTRGDLQQTQSMLRDLLAERFKLRTHTEVRELPMFRLVVARRDANLGRQLRRSNIDCATIRSKRGLSAQPATEEPSCRPSFKVNTKTGTLTIRLQGESMTEFARLLTSPETRRVVRDATGLTGNFDAELTFAPEPLPGFPALPRTENDTSLFTALGEQLGLKLEAERGPVEVLVIDGAEHPTGN